MAYRSKISLRVKQGLIFGTAFLMASSVLVPSPSYAQEEKKGFFGRLFDGDERKRRKAERRAAKQVTGGLKDSDTVDVTPGAVPDVPIDPSRRVIPGGNLGGTPNVSQADVPNAIPDAIPDANLAASPDAGLDISPDASRTELIQELKDAKQELTKRNFNNEKELAEAKAELARRQSTGQITPEQVKLTPARIRDQQLNELEKLKAELARRRLTNTTKAERIGRALTDNELAYRYVDQCITRPSGDFTNLFNGQADLELIVSEKKTQVFRNADRTLLLQTSTDACDVSFNGSDVADYAAGLVHILETQGGLVETKKLAGLTIINTVHPRGNFRLATGRKIIGSADTNLYTSIIALR
ncbi:MAG: hypothetical protein ABJN04_05835 [Hyphomicrobiales bacterium]